MFDLSTYKKVAKFTRTTDDDIQKTIDGIKRRSINKRMKASVPMFAVNLVMQRIYDNKTRLTSNFYVEDSCIGCGLCEKKCPVDTIKMMDKRPVWIKEKCAMCLGCLHRCPKFAIQYGDGKTKMHGQYINPNVNV